jgi:hypothetical protein
MRAIIAHEMAHYVLGHEPIAFTGPRPEVEAELYQRELEANVKAVEILTRVTGDPEAAALRDVHAWLISAWRAQQRPGVVIPFGHKSACIEAGELLIRFPQHRTWTASLPCAPSRWARTDDVLPPER